VSEFDIYSKIGQLLYQSSPEHSMMLIMNAELSEDSDVYTLFFDCINDEGQTNWFLCPPPVNHELSEMLAELRGIFIKEKRGFWLGLVFKLDLNSGKFDVEFKYKE
jgi:hypothetical protein